MADKNRIILYNRMNLNTYFTLVMSIIFYGLVHGMKKIKLRSDQCNPNKYHIPNFKASEFMKGVWYPVEKSTSLPFIGECDALDITSKDVNGKLEHTINLVNFKNDPSKTEMHLGVTETSSPNAFKLSVLGFDQTGIIVDTDNENYAVLLVCSDIFFIRGTNIMVLARQTVLSNELDQKIRENIRNKIGSFQIQAIPFNMCKGKVSN